MLSPDAPGEKYQKACAKETGDEITEALAGAST
jgi:hypothetical protein